MTTRKAKNISPEDMQVAVRDLGEMLRERGDLTDRLIEKCSDAIGISYRQAKRYWYCETPRPDRVHFKEIQRLLAGERTPQDELQELRDRIAQLERALVQTDPSQDRKTADEAWPMGGAYGRFRGSMAG